MKLPSTNAVGSEMPRLGSRAHDMLARHIASGSVSCTRIGSPGDLLRNHEKLLLTRAEVKAAERLTPRDPSAVFGQYRESAPLTSSPPLPPPTEGKMTLSNSEWLVMHRNRPRLASTPPSPYSRTSSPYSRPSPSLSMSPARPSPKNKTPPSPCRAPPYSRASRLLTGQVKRSRLVYDCVPTNARSIAGLQLSDKENDCSLPSLQLDGANDRSASPETLDKENIPSLVSHVADRSVIKLSQVEGGGGEDHSLIGRYDHMSDEDEELPRPVMLDQSVEVDDNLFPPDEEDLDTELDLECVMTREEEEAFRREETVKPHLIGLPNTSSRCWLNASLQCLMSLEPFVSSVLDGMLHRNTAQLPPSKILRTFSYLVSQRAQGKVYKVHQLIPEFQQSLRPLDPDLASHEQQDVSEFMVRFLDSLREEFMRMSCDGSTALRERQLNGEAADRQSNVNDREGDRTNPVLDNFTVTVSMRHTCEGCKSVSLHEEQVQMMAVSPSNSLTLQDALNKSMKAETVDRTCECGNIKAVTKSRIQRLPRFLILTVNRYQVDTQSGATKKLCKALRIPEWLSMDAVSTPDAAPPAPWTPPTEESAQESLSLPEPYLEADGGIEECELLEALDDDMRLAIAMSMESEAANQLPPSLESTPTKELVEAPPCDGSSKDCYHLVAVISHLGQQTNKGHYTADVLNYSQNAWFQYNDLSVTEVPFEKVTNRERCTNGYVFFYAHKTIHHQLLSRCRTVV